MKYLFKYYNKFANLEILFSENLLEKVIIEDKEKRYSAHCGKVFQPQAKVLCRHPLPPLANKISKILDSYFSGKTISCIDKNSSYIFRDIPVNLSGYGAFTAKILNTIRTVKPGETISYAELAIKAGFGRKYSRACASALSNNKTPIIIPCHRIIMSNGDIGGYSCGKGPSFKAKLLSLEKSINAL